MRRVVIASAAPAEGLQVQVLRDETELEAVRRTRDTVLANISHEFRTPLAAQLASIELLSDGIGTMSDTAQRELVSSLQRGTQRLTWLIDNLLESVRIESGQLGIRKQDVMFDDVIVAARELIEPLIEQRGQKIVIQLADDVPVIRGDEQRLTQVLVNLLANASKFGPAGSVIRIGARRRDAGGLDFWVEDEGPARRIPRTRGCSSSSTVRAARTRRERPRPRVVHRALDRRAPRRHRLARAHRGHAHARRRSPAEGAARVKILLVDDDPDLLAVTGFALQQAGFLVVKAGDGAAALDAFQREQPDLAVLDINLPKMSGFDLAQKLRERSKIPLIMLTARNEEEDVVRALSLGADDYEQAVQPEDPARARESLVAPRRPRGGRDRRVRQPLARRGRAHAARLAARRRAPDAARGALPAAPVRAQRPYGADGSAADPRLGRARRR